MHTDGFACALHNADCAEQVVFFISSRKIYCAASHKKRPRAKIVNEPNSNSKSQRTLVHLKNTTTLIVGKKAKHNNNVLN